MIALVFACMGSAYGTGKAGQGISAIGLDKPEIVMKNRFYESVVASCPSLAGKCIAITGTTSGTG